MKWLTIEYIKEHSRIDFACDDAALEMYGSSAEETILAYIRRTYNNILDKYGKVPADLYHAALMLTDVGYTHRSPVTINNMSAVLFTFDLKVSDYVRYDKATDLQAERDTLLDILGDLDSELVFDYDEISTPTSEQIQIYADFRTRIFDAIEKYKAVENPTEKICAKLRAVVNTIKSDIKLQFGE